MSARYSEYESEGESLAGDPAAPDKVVVDNVNPETQDPKHKEIFYDCRECALAQGVGSGHTSVEHRARVHLDEVSIEKRARECLSKKRLQFRDLRGIARMCVQVIPGY